jgi:hypothetical protein
MAKINLNLIIAEAAEGHCDDWRSHVHIHQQH